MPKSERYPAAPLPSVYGRNISPSGLSAQTILRKKSAHCLPHLCSAWNPTCLGPVLAMVWNMLLGRRPSRYQNRRARAVFPLTCHVAQQNTVHRFCVGKRALLPSQRLRAAIRFFFVMGRGCTLMPWHTWYTPSRPRVQAWSMPIVNSCQMSCPAFVRHGMRTFFGHRTIWAPLWSPVKSVRQHPILMTKAIGPSGYALSTVHRNWGAYVIFHKS